MPLAFDAKFRSLPRGSRKKLPWMSYRPASAVPPETPKTHEKGPHPVAVSGTGSLTMRKKTTDLAPAEISKIAKGLGQNAKVASAESKVAHPQILDPEGNDPQNKQQLDVSSAHSTCGSGSTILPESPGILSKIEKDEIFKSPIQQTFVNRDALLSAYETELANLNARVEECTQTINRQAHIIHDQSALDKTLSDLRESLAQEATRRQHAEHQLAILKDCCMGAHARDKELHNQRDQAAGKRTHSGNYTATRKRIQEAKNLTVQEREFLTSLI